MTKQEREFFATDDLPWTDAPGSPGVQERVLAQADDGPTILTRLARWAPGTDTTTAGVIRHDYVEEVYLLEGELTDLTLGQTFTKGHYASRPVGMPHGPYGPGPAASCSRSATRDSRSKLVLRPPGRVRATLPL